MIDCGTPINPNLARVQAEGGIGQGIGMVLYEDIQYTDKDVYKRQHPCRAGTALQQPSGRKT